MHTRDDKLQAQAHTQIEKPFVIRSLGQGEEGEEDENNESFGQSSTFDATEMYKNLKGKTVDGKH